MTIRNLYLSCSNLAEDGDLLEVTIHQRVNGEDVVQTLTLRDVALGDMYEKPLNVFKINGCYKLEVWFW